MTSAVTRGATLGVFALAMINVASIVSPRNGPLMAEYGWSMFFFLGCSILLFLVPIALASAELATGWPKTGGVYAWVREAFGERTGFLAIWCDWSENLTFFNEAEVTIGPIYDVRQILEESLSIGDGGLSG